MNLGWSFMRLRPGSFSLVLLCLACWPLAAQAQIQFDRPKTEPPLPNPYTITATREQILKTTREVLAACSIPLNEEASNPAEGKLVTQYYVFTKGVTVRNDLSHVCKLPASEVRNWIQGRYYLEIISLPLDEKRSQLHIIPHFQGQIQEVLGKKWVDCPSTGTLEDEVLRGLAGRILGIDLSVKGNNRRRLFNCEY
jgi:hypothetical protein